MKTIICARKSHELCSSYVILWKTERWDNSPQLAARGKKYHDDCTCDCHEKIQQEKSEKIEISNQGNLL